MTAVEKATEVRDSARSLKTALRVPDTANFTSAPWTKRQYAAVSHFETENTARCCKALTSESGGQAPKIQRSLQELGMWATVKALANVPVEGAESIRLSALGGIESLYPLGTTFIPTGMNFDTINSVPYKEGWYRIYRDARPAFLPEEMRPTYESLTAKLVDTPPPHKDNEQAQRTMRAISSLIQLIELNPDDDLISASSWRDESQYDSD
jgi:hypothetical protein